MQRLRDIQQLALAFCHRWPRSTKTRKKGEENLATIKYAAQSEDPPPQTRSLTQFNKTCRRWLFIY